MGRDKVEPLKPLGFQFNEFPSSKAWFNPVPECVQGTIDVKNSTYLYIKDRDQFYALVSKYAAKNCQDSCQSFEIRVQSKVLGAEDLYFGARFGRLKSKTRAEDLKPKREQDKDKCELRLGLGLHRLDWQGTDIKILHQCIGDPIGGQLGATCYRCIVLFVDGVGNAKKLRDFCEYVLAQDRKTYEQVLSIYRWQGGMGQGYWVKSGMKMARPLTSVVLPKKLKNMVMTDIEQFLTVDTHKFYFKHGIPYKRSYLFRGPPGSGKTSFIQGLAGHFKRNLCILQPTTKDMTDDQFALCVQSAPKDSIVVLEDVDALFDHHREKKTACPLTFSGVLNALDGIASPSAQIIILTTNHPERLDPALIRAGRVDMHVRFTKAAKEQCKNMFLNFYEGQEEHAKAFAATVFKTFRDGISMASLQQHFIRHMRSKGSEVVEAVPELKKWMQDCGENREKEKDGSLYC